MALPDLTGQNIENTYQRVIQTDGTNFYDGTGSLVNFGGAVFPYTGSAIISGSLIVTGSTDIQYLTASGIPYPTAIGGEGEAIVVDQDGNLIFAYPKAVTERVKNVSGGPLPKGTPVHATGSGTSGNIVGVVAADAGDPLLMPATFVLNEALADEAEGEALVVGYIQGVNTTGFDSGEVVYVGVGGGFTNIKPTGSNLIQNLGIVLKGNSNNGSGVVYGSGRSNDVPNLPPGYAWIGNENWVATAVPTSSFNEDPFPYTGSAAISGSLEVTGDVTIYGTASVNVLITNYESSSIIYSSGSTKFGDSLDDTHIFTGSVSVTGSLDVDNTVTAVTGSFSHLKGNSPITVQDSVTFQSDITASGDLKVGSWQILSSSNYIIPESVSGTNGSTFVIQGQSSTTGTGGELLLKGGYSGGARGATLRIEAGDPYGYTHIGRSGQTVYLNAGGPYSGHGAIFQQNGRYLRFGWNTTPGIPNPYFRITGTSSDGLHFESNKYYQFSNDTIISGSLTVSQSVSASTYYGDGSNLTGIDTDPFPYTGSAVISGSLGITGSIDYLNDGNGTIRIGENIAPNAVNMNNTIAIGREILNSTTSGTYAGQSTSVYIGHEVGKNVGATSNYGNSVWIGYQAGLNRGGAAPYNTTLIGYQAGTGGYSSVAIGNSAMNIGGVGSIGIGQSVGANNSGVSAILIGDTAGAFGSSTETIAIGYRAGAYSGPDYSVVIGHQASQRGGLNNSVILGYKAGEYSNGSNNVALGYNAITNTSATNVANTIAIGYQAGYISSGSNNILLGYQAGYNLTGSNQLIIANNSSSALVTGDFANNTFDVSGSISSTDTVTAVTGSFSHLKGNSPITVQDPTTFQQTLSVIGNATLSSINEVDIQTISRDISYTSSINITEIPSSVNGVIIDYRLTNLNSGSRVGTFMYAHDGTTLSYNDLTIPGAGIGTNPILSASLSSSLVTLSIENAAGFNFTGYAKKFNRLANAIPVADPNVSYFMDITNNNPVAAFSVRQLNQFYTGSAMRIRRASDNNEVDIGFDVNGNLDLITINTHCGSDVGYVTTWYDQSGNNNHATQSIASYQRRIYDGFNVYTINNKPALFGDINDHWLHNMPAGTTWSSIAVINPTGGNSFGMHSVLPYNPWFYLGDSPSGQTNVFGFNNGEIYQNTSQMSISTRGQFYTDINNIDQQVLTAFGDINFSSRPWRLGTSYGDSYGFNGYLQEAILYNTDESSNKNLYETNINNYYSIYDTGLLAEYPGAAAAYSVRQLTTAYTGSAFRIREDGTNTETDIGFDSNGDLDTASIASHCGANNGLVVTWYDQSGNGNDATQATTTNQPLIYSASAVITENGKPTIQFKGAKYIYTGNYSSLTEGELFISIRWLGDTTTRGGFKISTNGFNMHFPYYGGAVYDNFGSTDRYSFTPSINLNQLNLYNTISTSSEWTARLNTSTERTSTTNTVSFSTGYIGTPGQTMAHNVSEYVLYSSSQPTNRTGIENNINSYFNIY